MLISIVIPCYYSEKTIQKVVELTIQEFHAHKKYPMRVCPGEMMDRQMERLKK